MSFIVWTYLIWVIVGIFFHFDTFFPHLVARVLFKDKLSRRPLLNLLEIHVSLRSELPFHLFVTKIVFILFAYSLNAFDNTYARLTLYVLDIPSLLVCLYLVREMLREKSIVIKAINDLHVENDTDDLLTDTSFLRFPSLRLLLLPFWRPQDIIVHSNISYATQGDSYQQQSESDDNGNDRMILDIYASSHQQTGSRPVLVHVHGGGWRQGSKQSFYPFQKLLVQDHWIVINIGYRLAPQHPYPAQLYDVKRALGWIKANIMSYGGDPNFILISGDSSGGQLCALAALTAGQKEWQPGFESVDTSVRGVITLNGILDLQSDLIRKSYFIYQVAMQDKIDEAFLDQHSPLQFIEQHSDQEIPPFLILAGHRDAMVATSIAQNVKKVLNQGSSSNQPRACSLLVLPFAHHVWYLAWSIRSFYASRYIQAWCRQLYSRNLDS